MKEAADQIVRLSTRILLPLVLTVNTLVASTTYAAISPAQIEIRDEAAQKAKTGQSVDEILSGLSRDPANANNALAKIFDQKKVEETQELTRIFGEEAYKAVGDLAKHYTKDYEKAELERNAAKEIADKAAKAGDTQTEQAARAAQQKAQAVMDQNQAQYDAWKEGSTNKILLHGFVGAIQASLGGADATAGFSAAAIAESTRAHTAALPPELQQAASLVIGATAAKLAGGSSQDVLAGAATALDGEKYNRQLHQAELDRIRQIKKRFAKQYGISDEYCGRCALDRGTCSEFP